MTPDIHPEIVVWAAAASGLYAAAVRRVARTRTRPWPRTRTLAFAAGIVVLLGALVSPLAWRADDLLSDHMLEHLMLTLVAAPLLVLGAPLSLALQALPPRSRGRLASAVRSRPVRVLTFPAVTWAIFAATMLATHLTGFYDLAVRNDDVHLLEHGIYLVAALLFWLPVLGTNPVRQLRSWLTRTLYLLLAMPAMSIVAVVLVDATHPEYPAYAAAARRLGYSAMADQQQAAAYMWVFGSVLMVTATVAVGWQALVREERRQRVLDSLEAGT